MRAFGKRIQSRCRKVEAAIEGLNKKQEFIIVVLLFVLLVFGIILGMGTLTSGYHLVDDHEFLKWVYQMEEEGESVFEIIRSEVKMDLSIRYRPIHIMARVLETGIFGINLVYYSLVKAVGIVASCIFLYYIGRLMGANKIYSFLFSAVSMTGYQSAVWWKLGTHEEQATLLFAAGFFCLLKYLIGRKKKWAISSVLLFFVMCNVKESYMVLAPFIMLYVVYYELLPGDKKGEKFSLKALWLAIKKDLFYLIALASAFIIPITIVVFFVGTNGYDGVGIDSTIPFSAYLTSFSDAFVHDLKWYTRFGILFCLILLTYWEDLKKLWKEILLAVAFVLPQFLLYGQTGINERYILPVSIGYSFFFIVVIMKWKPLKAKRRAVYILGILLLLAANGRGALREADYFRYRGHSVTTMLETVQKMSEENEDIKVLSCFRPNEEGNLTIDYWMRVHGMDNVYFWTEEDQIINKVVDRNLYYREEAYEEQPFEDMNIVVMYNKEDRHWCYTPGLDLTDFTELKCGTLTLYVRNGSGIEIPDTTVEGLRINF